MEKLLEVKNLKKYYPVTRGLLSRHVADVRAVDGVSLYLEEGETLGLVGESGCGKSSLGRTLLLLERPTAGEIIYQGVDITGWNKRQLKGLRKKAQMIFQDPQSSLDPRMNVGDSIGEALLTWVLGMRKRDWSGLMSCCGVWDWKPTTPPGIPTNLAVGKNSALALPVPWQ